MYAQSLVEVGKLVYLVGENTETAKLKKTLEANEPKYVFSYPATLSFIDVSRKSQRALSKKLNLTTQRKA